MKNTPLFSQRPSMPPASVAFRVQPLPLTCPDRASSAPSAPAGAYRGGSGEGRVAVATIPAMHPVAAIQTAGKGLSVSAAKAATVEPKGTKQDSKNDAANVDRVTGVGGHPPRGRPN